MQLRNEFSVPGDPDRVFDTLLDLERVATCMPGATLLERDGDRYRGRLKLKVGPIAAAYEGTVTITEADRDARRAVLSASGSETGGQGGAEAAVRAQVSGDGEGSTVEVVTDLQVRGRAAQFGRGVLGDVSQRMLDQFSRNLEALLLAPDGAGEPAAEPPPAPAPAATGAAEPDAGPSLDVLSVVALPAARRALPYVLSFLAGVLLGRLARRRPPPASPGASPIAWPVAYWPPTPPPPPPAVPPEQKG